MNKESLIKLMNKLGKWETAKILGITMSELLRITQSPLFAEECYDVILELVRNEEVPAEYKGFIISSNSFGGTISWFPKTSIRTEYKGRQFTEGIGVLATPYWDGRAILPYNVDYYELYNNKELLANEEQPDIYFAKKIPGRFRNIDELIQWYKEVYLPGVYDNIMNTILPQLRADYI